jgi:hypothetical protein
MIIELFKKFKTFTQQITCVLFKWVTLACAQAHLAHPVAPPIFTYEEE